MVEQALARVAVPFRIVIDCFHASFWSWPDLQPLVAGDAVNQIRDRDPSPSPRTSATRLPLLGHRPVRWLGRPRGRPAQNPPPAARLGHCQSCLSGLHPGPTHASKRERGHRNPPSPTASTPPIAPPPAQAVCTPTRTDSPCTAILEAGSSLQRRWHEGPLRPCGGSPARPVHPGGCW